MNRNGLAMKTKKKKAKKKRVIKRAGERRKRGDDRANCGGRLWRDDGACALRADNIL